MGIYAQPNSWQCGPFALKHALLAHGVFAHEDEIARVAGSTEKDGTDDWQLARAARAWGCELSVVRRSSARGAQAELAAWLARGVPVLLCLDQWEHWVTAVAADGERVVVFDSQFDDAVLRIEPWERLLARVVCRRRRWRGLWVERRYDLHPLVPAEPAAVRLTLTPARVERLTQLGDPHLAVRWDDYARRLLPLALSGGRPAHTLRLDRFLMSNCDRIVAEIVRSRGFGVRAEAERVLRGLAVAAELYDLRVRPILVRRAVTRVAAIVAGFIPAKPARIEPMPQAQPTPVIAASA